MWFFRSPHIVFGEDSLSYLAQIRGRRAYIVTDETIVRLGFAEIVAETLNLAGIYVERFSQIEAEPSLATVKRCAEALIASQPDLVVGLGGGSCLDAAKVAWFIYERPDVSLDEIVPIVDYGLRSKARLILIPTTAGSGSEASQAALIYNPDTRSKMYMVSYEFIPDYCIVDPRFTAQAPRQITADAGIDVLSHAIDTYHSTIANDFIDGICLQAAQMVFDYLPAAVRDGHDNSEARLKMANAATLAGIAIGNSNIALVHGLGHAAGAIFRLPHGRVTAIFLPGVIEYITNGGVGRYYSMARMLGVQANSELEAGLQLAEAVRDLMKRVGLPLNLQQAGISREQFERELGPLCDHVESDLAVGTSRRFPYREDIQRLLEYAYEGRNVDF